MNGQVIALGCVDFEIGANTALCRKPQQQPLVGAGGAAVNTSLVFNFDTAKWSWLPELPAKPGGDPSLVHAHVAFALGRHHLGIYAGFDLHESWKSGRMLWVINLDDPDQGWRQHRMSAPAAG